MFVEDIEAWEKQAKVKIGPGDAIFLRTGRWARRAKLGPWAVGQNEAGYHASVAPWLKERGVSFLGSDDAQDVTPSLVTGMNLPVHTLAIAAPGDRHSRQPGSRGRCANGGAAEQVGVPADRRTGARDRRNRLSGKRARDLLTLELQILNFRFEIGIYVKETAK